MRTKIMLAVIALCVLSFVAGICVTKGFAEEHPTKTLYNNHVPYKAFFDSFSTNLINVQVGKTQAVIPVVNDSEKDLTQKEEDQKKGN